MLSLRLKSVSSKKLELASLVRSDHGHCDFLIKTGFDFLSSPFVSRKPGISHKFL